MTEREAGPETDAADASAQPILAAAEALAPETARPRPPAPPVPTSVEAPSTDVETPVAEAVLPGTHRGGFTRPPTAPLALASFGANEPRIEFVPATGTSVAPVAAVRPANLAAIGLGFAVVGLIASFVVGLALPIALAGLVLGALSLRRRAESRQMAIWAIALGALAVIYSAGWLVWAAYRAGWWG
ncbi:hypothetical protein [Microbacterium sp. cx-59]|uniref:hypothetical protein n=1 Tax=Microbacterium sp. cx-59 TaxID=2891207 RepID=UPI001E5AF4BE|nr:hypothetical protein [Microbacterium sp. cx-59]MCC4908007.1 hypothetical protein [Microbacterium sp. cx-59]